ncbi:MAG: hypothetical protein CMN84_09240 [Spongiibacteraceae bacterium]|jgi:hypothetical protein|nr:hypothetical protein [Spongiibacteraceae bacterium]
MTFGCDMQKNQCEKFFFGIPLISKSASKDWERIQYLFENTLRSILAQTDPNFKVLVAGHEMPEVVEMQDPRVEFLACDSPPPKTSQEMMADKGSKAFAIARRLKEAGGGYLMYVDADDLVSNRIVDWVHSNPSHGYLADKGYCLDIESGKAYTVEDLVGKPFHQICGTCSIIYFDEVDLPDGPSPEESSPCYFMQFGGHTTLEKVSSRAGRPLIALPFVASVYVLNHGLNYSEGALLGLPRHPLRIATKLLARWQSQILRKKLASIASEFSVPARYMQK